MIEIVGHRGAAALLPENTLPSFEHAIGLGCDATECDVRLSADGHLVICHDDTVDRTTNGTGRVADLSLAALRALDAGGGATLPTLAELLAVVAGRIVLLCELKGPGTPAPTVAAVRAAGLVEQVVFTSFDLDRLTVVRQAGAELRLAGIFSHPPDAATVARLVALGAEAADVHYRHLTAEFVATAHAAGLRCRGWNPDTADEIRSTIALGVDSVSSNRPDLALAVRAESATAPETRRAG